VTLFTTNISSNKIATTQYTLKNKNEMTSTYTTDELKKKSISFTVIVIS